MEVERDKRLYWVRFIDSPAMPFTAESQEQAEKEALERYPWKKIK